ncbi:unnamed protein product [Periconia digitata]|uniref:Malic acid transport protein n=1 Tax=Periconia digitata TaxID=1303443 RepID=A0A9W4XLG3_9PLEO|nr:unnamed protein product [Periconia digitata]
MTSSTRQRRSHLPTVESNHGSESERLDKDNLHDPEKVTFRQRIKHFTFAWFAGTMATGGIATLLNAQPNQFTGLKTIGKVVFIYDLVLFVAFTAIISARFVMFRGTFMSALTHPTESLFIPTFFLSIVNIFDCIQAYAVPVCGTWLLVVQRIAFWIYLACTFLLAVGQYTYLFTAPPNRLTVQSMTPSWLLPIFPAMLTGTFASQIVSTQPEQHQATIIVAGITMQGLGWMVSFLMYGVYITRLMQYGLPEPKLRPGMFIAVGPPSFTGLALIGISTSVPSDYGVFAANQGMAEMMKQLALLLAIFIWALAFWFFCIALVATLQTVKQMSFKCVWYAMIFPNVGLTIALIQIGKQLLSPAIQWITSIMTIILIGLWLFVMVAHARAVVQKQVMMPGLDEDNDQYEDDNQ